MAVILAVLVFMIVFGLKTSTKIRITENKADYRGFLILALACLVVKIILSGLYYGHSTDMDCFWGWSEMISKSGFRTFYESGAFTDYPPGYMYILYALGSFKNIFEITDTVYVILLKMPAVLCDIVTGCIIYKFSKCRFSKQSALILSASYMLNPAVILNSSLWGQVDSVYTLGVILTLLMILERKLIYSFFIFAICVFIKPQSLIFTPILIFSVIDECIFPKPDFKRLSKIVLGGIGTIFLMIVMALPFGVLNVLEQYINTIGSYPYLTVNAFNMWGALGQNWTELTPYFSVLSIGFILLITLLSARVFFYNKGKERYFMTSAFLFFSTFMLSVKMHDRYAFPVISMLLLAFVFSSRKDIFWAFILVSVSQFFNTSWVLFIYEKNINFYAQSITVVIASLINVLLLVYVSLILTGVNIQKIAIGKRLEHKTKRITRLDYLIVFSIALLYSVFAFYDLGDFEAPKTSVEIEDSVIEIELYNEERISEFFYYLGADAIESDFTISFYNQDGDEVLNSTQEEGNAFYWNSVACDVLAKKAVLSTDKKSLELFEVILKNEDVIIPIKSCNYPVLTDEQELLPERVTFRNSTYFDEIYHARTAYEFIEGKEVYEWTHPPLGKILISIGIKIFGMTPFGWRIIGTVFGVLMIFVMYNLAKKIFKESFISSLCTVMLTFDFMHFTQSRIATIDVYVTFFIMLMYLFMYKYYVLNFNSVSLKESFKPLFFAGVSFGLGASVKWTAMYACAGLAVIFFMTVVRRYKENKEVFWNWFIKTALFCVLAFIIIPVVIYCISYIPYMNAENNFSFNAIWDNQKDMLTYHGKTVVGSTHPYSSKWFSWPVIYRPMWYYDGYITDTVKEGISAFGNPMVWWFGIPSVILSLYFAILKRSKKAWFLIIGYLSCLLPWVFVERTTYIYHYFPCVIFSILMTCYCINKLDFKYKRYIGIVVMSGTIVLFVLFYPVLSGQAVSTVYVDEVLRWFDSWVLIG